MIEKPLPRCFFKNDAARVANELLGKILVRKYKNSVLAGKIVETEAYYGADDPASRAHKSKKTNLSKWWRCALPGTVFVYMVHGNWLLNIVTGKINGEPSGVLIRAVEPLKGMEIMMKNRNVKEIEKLTSGPGKLTSAFGIAQYHTGLNVSEQNSDIIVIKGKNENIKICSSHRIGVSEDLPQNLRFYLANNKFVSKKNDTVKH